LKGERSGGKRDGDQKVKISKNQLLQIIKEELQSALKESVPPALAQLMDDRETLERVLPTLHTKAAKDMITSILSDLKPMEFPPREYPGREDVMSSPMPPGVLAALNALEELKRNKRNK
jgi:DNA primase large subunit